MAEIRLNRIDTRAPDKLSKEDTKKDLKVILAELDDLQNLLFAERKHSILVIIQGIDASGKDGLVKETFTSMNPAGVNVTSFKEPTGVELEHDFLWRVHQQAPAKGMIAVFNRSHYEDVLVTRVHKLVDDKTAAKRMQAINDFEQLLEKNNDTHILKFYLHVSHTEQQERLHERLENPHKMWKYNKSDFKESKFWDQYMGYYEEVFAKCNNVPWHIIPSDQNWYKCYLVAKQLRDTLKGLNMQYPTIAR